MSQDLSLDAFRASAERAGFILSVDEAKEALAGANRWRRNVEQLRTLLSDDLEPASVFRSPGNEHGA
jgi:hypothetical protein